MARNEFVNYSKVAAAAPVGLLFVDLFLFALFAFYGPTFKFLGQLRFVELALLGLSFFGFRHLLQTPTTLEWRITLYFVFTSVVYVLVGLWLQSPTSAIVLRGGTYFLMAVMLLVVMMMTAFNERRMIFVILGYCLSYLTSLMFVDYLTNSSYELVPWRLGLGFATTWALTCLFVLSPRIYPYSVWLMLAMVGIHITLGARSLGLICFVVAILMFFSMNSKGILPGRFKLGQAVGTLVLMLVLGYGGLLLLYQLALSDVLSDDLTQRLVTQFANPRGIVAASRPDTYVAFLGALKSPLIGFGPSNTDIELNTLYITLIAENFETDGNFQDMFELQYLSEFNLGIPSHSHILGAWVEAGVLAAAVWMIVLALVGYVLARSVKFRNVWTPMYLLICISTLWDIVFSPGPHRVDVVLRLIVLFYAVRQFKQYDVMAQQAWSAQMKGAPHTHYAQQNLQRRGR